MGEKFMLDAQQETNKFMRKEMQKGHEAMLDQHNHDKYEIERECKKSQQMRQALDDEVRSLQNQLDKTKRENFENVIKLESEAAREEKRRSRHTED